MPRSFAIELGFSFAADDGAVTSINFKFDQGTARAQHLDLVDPEFKVFLLSAFQFDIDDLSGVFAFNPFKNGA